MTQHVYNLQKDTKDKRDFLYRASKIALPASVDLSPKMIKVLDQGQFGSCTAHTMVYAMLYTFNKGKDNENCVYTLPSRFFIYTNGRKVSGYPIDQDTGCSIRSIYKATSMYFACEESLFPYIAKNAFINPPEKCYATAKSKHSQFRYVSIPQTLKSLKTCLAEGYVISFGLQIFESFESDKCMKTGIVPIPDKNLEQLLGGHALTIVGYSDKDKMFLVINSWGTNIGLPTKKGYFKIPYAVIADPELASDFWSMRMFY